MRGVLGSVTICLTAIACDMGVVPVRSVSGIEPEPFTANDEIDSAHISKWKIAKGGLLTLPIVPAAGNDFTVDWGDGTIERYTYTLAEHTYAKRGMYTVKITGKAKRWSFFAIPHSRHKIVAVTDFGDLGWQNLDGAFWQAENLIHVADGDVSAVTSMRLVFAQATDTKLDIANWNTRNVTDMHLMFADTRLANPDVSNWDVSAVINMAGMFSNARAAKPDVGEWNVSAVEDMSEMFAFTTSAKPNVSKWDTGNVRDMRAMFRGAVVADPDVSSWDVSKVSHLDYMFADAVIAKPNVSKWDTGNALSMRGLFSGAVSANPDVFSWDTSRVATLAEMFKDAINASPRLMCWDVAQVTDMRSLFAGAVRVDADFSKWDFSSSVFMQDMFRDVRLSSSNYNALIKQLAATALQSNVIFNAGNSKYDCDAKTARQQLVDRGWIINDAGMSKPCEGGEGS